MSVKASSAVWEHSKAPTTARFVLLALADEANSEGEITAYRRSQSWLAQKTGLTVRSVQRAIKVLVEIGELEVLKVGQGITKSDYRILLPGLGGDNMSPLEAESDDSASGGSRPSVVTSDDSASGGSRPSVVSNTPFLPVDTRSCPKTIVGETSSPDVLQPDEVITTSLTLVSETETIDEVQTVFDTWRRATGKLRAKLDAKRRKRIQDALKNYSLDDVLAAVQGWQYSRFHAGENENGRVYNDLDLLLRDASKIEFFRDLWFAGPPAYGSNEPKAFAAIREFLREVEAQ